ncbi:hypothetical protein E2C01_031453 [Portunus trituberculatus]|uniref:Uncharacterized protein n=1 Tax=Portunus trituberculatus TaxID=210409 RepID=A0A5B7EXQ6_PORTR|nr:hypothetical protein [Portunus trituberculatus]
MKPQEADSVPAVMYCVVYRGTLMDVAPHCLNFVEGSGIFFFLPLRISVPSWRRGHLFVSFVSNTLQSTKYFKLCFCFFLFLFSLLLLLHRFLLLLPPGHNFRASSPTTRLILAAGKRLDCVKTAVNPLREEFLTSTNTTTAAPTTTTTTTTTMSPEQLQQARHSLEYHSTQEGAGQTPCK